MSLDRAAILPEPDLPDGRALLDEGRRMGSDWTVGPSAFLAHHGVSSETAFKQAAMSSARVMQHAQIGYRALDKSVRAYAEIWESCAIRGVSVDRYGLCLDWSMAVPRAERARAQRGTGMILDGPEDFARLANAAPVAPHFGDFVLGFPAALENTQAALAAGSTAIGNLGQYFNFRIPGFGDDVAATRATVQAIGLIAAQPVPVIVHSNLDDGFAAQFTDLASSLGQMLLEQDVIGRLAGAPTGHCYGHHFSDPLTRRAFQEAMAVAGLAPGTVIYGNTTSFRGTVEQNLGSLASYLLVDALGQRLSPTGHAINAVPVTENERIPDIDEVIAAQLVAGRIVEASEGWTSLIAPPSTTGIATRLVEGGRRYHRAVLAGLEAAGIDTADLFDVLLALRRIGPRRLEALFGAGREDAQAPGGRAPVVAATIVEELTQIANRAMAAMDADELALVAAGGLRVLSAAGDVHEHGKMAVDELLRCMGVEALDGGVSTDPDRLARLAEETRPDVIAISTYNGVALSYLERLAEELEVRGLDIPILMGGRLNQLVEGSNSSLPRDVGVDLEARGAILCRTAADLCPALAGVIRRR